MSKKIRIRCKRGWIGYPGSTIQQNYAEDLVHGYLLWKIDSPTVHDVEFCSLSNPKPYITIPWQGDVDSTMKFVMQKGIQGARYRIHSLEALHQKEALTITSRLRLELSATEVVFKTDRNISRDVIYAGDTQLAKENLRNVDVLVKLLKEFHHGNLKDNDNEQVHDLLTDYMSLIDGSDDVIRNTKWSLKHLKFDNTYTYGENNSINFADMHGITGVFGPNRIGKSSILGTIAYALFNSTDRGSIKNLHVVNSRKPYCLTRALISVNGTDYLIERQTVKNETRKGIVNASTALNMFRIDESGEAHDLAGEERKDTERTIRKLIGSQEDFFLTSCAAQDEMKLFLSHGSTRRNQILTRFLDLDIFNRMFEMAKNNLNETKAQLRALPERDWTTLRAQYDKKRVDADKKLADAEVRHHEIQERLEQLRQQLSNHSDYTPVTQNQVETQRVRVANLQQQLTTFENSIASVKQEIIMQEEKISKIQSVLVEYNIADLKRRQDAYRTLDSNVIALRHSHEKETLTLKQHERSLKILDEVPCGDSFPTCKFIKDAYQVKDKVEGQRDKTLRALEKLQRASEALDVLRSENLTDKVSKLEKLHDTKSKLQLSISTNRMELLRYETSKESLLPTLESAHARLLELEEALRNEENAEVVSLRSEIDELQRAFKALDVERLETATDRGRIQTLIDKYDAEREQRESVVQQMRRFELVASAFSKKGLPAVIVRSQLPIINAEIARILQGIVDFTIELETDEDSDSIEIMIDDRDGRRIIELASGMEKTIASIAIRVALINVSSLPKSDMFILDEGFGVFDPLGVEACNRLLESLKRFFRTIVVITHVDAIKDVADQFLEITRNEKDSVIVYG